MGAHLQCVLCFEQPDNDLCHRCMMMKGMLMREIFSRGEFPWYGTRPPHQKTQVLNDFMEFKHRAFNFATWRDSCVSATDIAAPALAATNLITNG